MKAIAAALRGNRLWRILLDSEGDAEQPQAYFVGEYGRMRTVVTLSLIHI